MVDAIVSAVLGQLVSLAVEEAKEQVRLVVGVDQEVEKLKSNLRAIQAVLVDAEQRQHKDEAVRLWLDDLKNASYDMEDVLDEWIAASLKRRVEGVDENNALVPHKQKVCSFFPAASCFGSKPVFLRHDIAEKIKSINQALNEIAERKDRYNFNRSTGRSEWIPTTSLIDVSDVRGRDDEKETLKSKLLCESSDQKNSIQIISILGMGGIGKTTLAQFAYNDTNVIKNFEKKIWVCISKPFDQFRIAKAILEALEGSTPNLGELESLLLRIGTFIVGKKFFLVLDDVWTEDRNQWEPFHNCLKSGGHGSKILVTTRKESVAQMMASVAKMKPIIVNIEKLLEQDCWSLFEQFAFFDGSHLDREEKERIGKEIVDKCKGLPLAVKTMGSMLRFKRSSKEWQSILESEFWHLEEFGRHLFPPLLLSYNDLPSKIKQCFSYCAVFLKDYDIEKDELIRLWMAQGYISPEGNKEMEMVGEEYFNYLASRSFFQEFKKDDEGTLISCKMHDLVHDFAQFLTKNECFILDSNNLERLCFEKLRHLTLVLRRGDEFPISIIKAKKIRSLLIDCRCERIIPRDIFDQLTCLRTIKIDSASMTFSSIREIPKEIKELTQLRYLKLEKVFVEKLPETCCELFNLQTFEMIRCGVLKELPQGIGKLVNLRRLIIEDVWLENMPKVKERLLCLRTLSNTLGISRGVDGRQTCKVKVLKDLNQLRGSIRIGLHVNVRNVDEVKNVDLEKMENVVGLKLYFHLDLDENGAEYEAICDALRPPQNLESLMIIIYEAKNRWPIWIMSFHKLKKLSLVNCRWCEIMPPLGKLPSLEILQIWDLWSVKRVGDEFLGIEERDDVHGGTSSSVIAFPKLKQLTFQWLNDWEEWDFGKKDIAIMPQLNYLCIKNCYNLRSIPEQLLRSMTLNKLEINSCPILKERFRKDTGEDWSNISHIPNIQINDRYVQGSQQQQYN